MPNLILNPTTQKHIETVLANMPQALLVTGQKGSGVGTVAHHIASNLSHTPLVVMPKKRLSNGTKLIEDVENGAILIDDIRQLYDQTRAGFDKPQPVVLDFYDRTMTTGAQNAFLKLLEEPQPNIYFILATHHPDQLLPTIRSRCQRLDVRRISASQTVSLLDELNVGDPTRRARISYIAGDLPAEIHRLSTDEAYYGSRVEMVQDAKTVLEGTTYSKLLVVRKYKDTRPQAIQLIDDLLMQLQGALERTTDQRVIRQIDQLINARKVIAGNGNIQLQLARVLL